MKKERTKIVIAGANGLLGQALTNYFKHKADEIHLLHRGADYRKGILHYHHWDGKTAGPWMDCIDGATALINLAGRSVNCRYTAANKREILESRVNSTLALGAAVIMANKPPQVWLNSSTATIYQHEERAPHTEESRLVGGDFSMGVAEAWEQTFFEIPVSGVRKVALRTAIVLANEGGALPVLKNLCKWGLGGKQGSGSQRVSWIGIHDFCRAVDFVIQHPQVEQVVNVVSPHAVTNSEFMLTLRKHTHSKFGLPQPTLLLKLGALMLGTEAELVVKSRWVVPEKLNRLGFQFLTPTLSGTLKYLEHENTVSIASQPVVEASFSHA